MKTVSSKRGLRSIFPSFIVLTLVFVMMFSAFANAVPVGSNTHISNSINLGYSSSTNKYNDVTTQVNGTITISGNEGFLTSKYVSSGNGTKTNPFVIRDLSLKVLNDTGISITDTTSYFLLKDISILLSPISKGYEAGIYLVNATNGDLENLTISSPAYPNTYTVNGTYLSNETLAGIMLFIVKDICIYPLS